MRKPGKLPGSCIQASYEKEYGRDVFEMQREGVQSGQNVLVCAIVHSLCPIPSDKQYQVVDDLIATGGSASAAGDLVSQLGGNVVSYLFVVSLPFLKGSDKLNAPSWSIVEAED